MKRALVISGGGSKGAFAGGVSEYLIKVQSKEYDIFVGSSTGSLLLPHLALNQTDKLKRIYTNVDNKHIFSRDPFIKKKKNGQEYVTINYLITLLQFIKKKKTFGESKNLRRTIERNFSYTDFLNIKYYSDKDIIVTVSNLTDNRVEYKSIKDFNYKEFLDWIWISCNLVPFMSLVKKNHCEYADGGFGSMVSITEAIRRGAKEIDVIVLESESPNGKIIGKNPFALMMNLYSFMLDQVERHDIREGKLCAIQNDVILNFYYTPNKLTDNSLLFNKDQMKTWWENGFKHAEWEFNKSSQKSNI